MEKNYNCERTPKGLVRLIIANQTVSPWINPNAAFLNAVKPHLREALKETSGYEPLAAQSVEDKDKYLLKNNLNLSQSTDGAELE